MMWRKFILLFILFLLGRHLCFPSSPRYLELADSADFFIARENWNRAEEKIIEALRLEPANFSNSLLLANLGLIQTNKGKYDEAIESLSMGLQLAPSSTVLLNNRAHTFLLLDSIDRAIADLDKSLQKDSLQEWTLKTRAFISLSRQDIPKAKLLFGKLQTFAPDNSSLYGGLAAIAEYEGNNEEAKKNYLKALELNPNDDETRQAYILWLINNNDYTNARTQIREGLAKNMEDPFYYLLRGYLHRLNYRPDEALADKKIAISKGIDLKLVEKYLPNKF